MAHKKIERKKELDRRRQRRAERLKLRAREAKAAAKASGKAAFQSHFVPAAAECRLFTGRMSRGMRLITGSCPFGQRFSAVPTTGMPPALRRPRSPRGARAFGVDFSAYSGGSRADRILAP